MGEDLRKAGTVIVTLGEYEWVFNNAMVSIGKRTVEIWYEDDEGELRHIATAPIGSTFIAWEGLEDFELDEEGLEALDEEEGLQDYQAEPPASE